jgi:hypothetical protein
MTTMPKRFICEIKVTEVEYAGDHDRELVVSAASGEADTPDFALWRTYDAVKQMLAVEPREEADVA